MWGDHILPFVAMLFLLFSKDVTVKKWRSLTKTFLLQYFDTTI